MSSRAFAVAAAPLLSVVAVALLIAASLSAPSSKSLSFLSATVEGQKLIVGTFGYCVDGSCSDSGIGYELKGPAGSTVFDSASQYSVALDAGLTKALVLVPIAGAVAAIAALLGIAAAFASAPALPLMSAVVSAVASVFALAAFAVCMVLFPLGGKRLRDAGAADVSLGTANWLVAAAVALLAVSCIIAFCGSRKTRRMRRDEHELLGSTSLGSP